MSNVSIQDAPQAIAANLTDRIPVSQGDGLAKTVTVRQMIAAPAVMSAKTANYTLSASTDAGAIITFTAAATLTLPAASGFPEGFQCIVWNQAATAVDVTLSGTVVADGTKVPQKKAIMLTVRSSTWYAAGGMS